MLRDATFKPTLKLDHSSSLPLHIQLSKKIILQIQRQKPKSGAKLFSERKLAETLSLDRSTVHRAYQELIKFGIVERRPASRGLFVTREAINKLRQPFPNIGILLPERFSDFMDEKVEYRLRYMKGIIDRAAELEYSTIMINLPPVNSSIDHINKWRKHVINRLVGVIHLGSRNIDNDLSLEMILNETSIPQVFLLTRQ